MLPVTFLPPAFHKVLQAGKKLIHILLPCQIFGFTLLVYILADAAPLYYVLPELISVDRLHNSLPRAYHRAESLKLGIGAAIGLQPKHKRLRRNGPQAQSMLVGCCGNLRQSSAANAT